MAIDTSCEVQAAFFKRWMTVGRMREILEEIESDAELYPNRVGNLAVKRGYESIGYIDFYSEMFVPLEGDDG